MANAMGIDYAADKREQQADRGQVVTYNGSVLPAIVSLPDSFREVDDDGAGYFDRRTLIVEVSRDRAGAAVAIGDKLTYEGSVYRIANVGPASETGWYYLTCEGEVS